MKFVKKLEIHDNTSNRNKLKEWAVKNEVEIPIISVLTKDRYEVKEPMTFVPIHVVLHI